MTAGSGSGVDVSGASVWRCRSTWESRSGDGAVTARGSRGVGMIEGSVSGCGGDELLLLCHVSRDGRGLSLRMSRGEGRTAWNTIWKNSN